MNLHFLASASLVLLSTNTGTLAAEPRLRGATTTNSFKEQLVRVVDPVPFDDFDDDYNTVHFDDFDEDEDKLKMIGKSDVFLSGAFLSSALADDYCESSLPRTTQAHPYGRNYQFTNPESGFVGGPPPSTKCSANEQKTSEHKHVKSADDCADVCANEDVNSKDKYYALLGYNYNCHTKKCDCIQGEGSLSTKEKNNGGYWACYKSNTVTPPTPTPPPTPAQCLPSTVTGTDGGSTTKFTRVAPQNKHTSCDTGDSSYLPFLANSVKECANKCAAKMLHIGGEIGGLTVIGFDYDCDSTKCTCLTGNSGTNLRGNIRKVPANKACYLPN